MENAPIPFKRESEGLLPSPSAAHTADVTSLDSMKRTYSTALERVGHLDAVVANAGVDDGAPLGETIQGASPADVQAGVGPAPTAARPLINSVGSNDDRIR
jgi:NAD(P)-dependent dehydrogenase (short-subunit alcohol dehydrogenase family)